MTTASDILLGLIIIVGAIQMMYADSIGTLRMTIGQFIGRALLTAILIHLSGFIGEELLILNNLLCGVVTINITDFILQINHGKLFTANQQLIVMGALGIVFLIGFFRVLFQTIKRLIRFNVLFVLSGPAFLTSFHPATSPIFSIWSRMYVMTIFEQFLQVLTFGLGFQFLISVKQTGLPGFIMAVALMNMTAEVPALLARFGAAPGGQGGSSFGSLVGTGIKVAAVLAA